MQFLIVKRNQRKETQRNVQNEINQYLVDFCTGRVFKSTIFRIRTTNAGMLRIKEEVFRSLLDHILTI